MAATQHVLRPLRHRDYRFVAAASMVSLFGDGLFAVAIALQVYAVSNAPTAMAAVGMVWTGSAVAVYLFGGYASDRFERRSVMMVADLVRAAAVGAIGMLSLTGRLALWHLLVAGVVVGAANAFFNPAATAIVPDLLPDGELTQANAFLGVARPIMLRMLGPAAGGFLIAQSGPGIAFVADAVTFMASATLLAALHPRLAAAAARSADPTDNVALRPKPLERIGAGLSYVRSQRWLAAALVAMALSVLASWGPVQVLLPFVLRNDLGMSEAEAARQFGFVLAGGGVGAILVSVHLGRRDLPKRFLTALYIAEGGGVLAVAGYGLLGAPWHAIPVAVVGYGLFACSEIIWVTVLQRSVPRELLGRVSGVDWLCSAALLPASFALTGPLAQLIGAREVLIGAGVLGAAGVFGMALLPGARDIERRDIERRDIERRDDAEPSAPPPQATEPVGVSPAAGGGAPAPSTPSARSRR